LATVKKQEGELGQLRAELELSRQAIGRYEEEAATSYALVNLKLRQYEAEERERAFELGELKEKERRKSEQMDRTIKALKELLKEKEEANSQAKEQLIASEQKASKAQVALQQKEEEFVRQLEIKETFIRELSAEIGDLKGSLRSLEERIREMIDQESEMRETTASFNEAKALYKEKDRLSEAAIGELRGKIGELNEIVFKRESALIAYKQLNAELEEKLRKQSGRNSSPPRSSSSSSKLAKDN
jgi:chromosome segregation ATPase